jgi:hypothetical protein
LYQLRHRGEGPPGFKIGTSRGSPLFSRWWLEQTGEIIPEIGGTSKHEEQPWRT